MRVLLDTHVWLWWQLADSYISERERAALDEIADAGGICLPAICLWEAQVLTKKARIRVPGAFGAWLRRATAPNILTVLPLSVDVVVAMDELPQSFHADPADRMIVATARVHDLPLATHDKAITKSRLVKIWKP